jgi:hypothetical protein
VVRFLKLFTFLDLDEIDELGGRARARPRRPGRPPVLAREATRIVHGDAGVAAAEQATAVLFGDVQPFAGLDDATLAEAFEEAPPVLPNPSRSAGAPGVGCVEPRLAGPVLPNPSRSAGAPGVGCVEPRLAGPVLPNPRRGSRLVAPRSCSQVSAMPGPT